MGCFNSIIVPCPICCEENELQSKSGTCEMKRFHFMKAPLKDIAEVADKPFVCKQCSEDLVLAVQAHVAVHTKGGVDYDE